MTIFGALEMKTETCSGDAWVEKSHTVSGVKHVEQNSAIRCDLRRYGSINDSLTVTFTSSINAQNLSE